MSIWTCYFDTDSRKAFLKLSNGRGYYTNDNISQVGTDNIRIQPRGCSVSSHKEYRLDGTITVFYLFLDSGISGCKMWGEGDPSEIRTMYLPSIEGSNRFATVKVQRQSYQALE